MVAKTIKSNFLIEFRNRNKIFIIIVIIFPKTILILTFKLNFINKNILTLLQLNMRMWGVYVAKIIEL